MHDSLEELSDLSNCLQKGDITLATTNRKIMQKIEIFRSRKDNPATRLQVLIFACIYEVVGQKNWFIKGPIFVSKMR
jgi:stalled ribosome rescue protein Dom34